MSFAQLLLDKERMAHIAAGESKHVARAAKGRDKRPVTIAAAAAIILGFTVVSAYLAGTPDTVDASIVAMADSGDRSTTVINAQSMDDAEMTDWVQPDWQASGLIPVEAKIMRHGDADVLVASLLVGLEPVVIIEKRGRLAAVVVQRAPRIAVNDINVYVVNSAPLQVLWQSGSVVVAATCTCAIDTLATAIAAFPRLPNPASPTRLVLASACFAPPSPATEHPQKIGIPCLTIPSPRPRTSLPRSPNHLARRPSSPRPQTPRRPTLSPRLEMTSPRRTSPPPRVRAVAASRTSWGRSGRCHRRRRAHPWRTRRVRRGVRVRPGEQF